MLNLENPNPNPSLYSTFYVQVDRFPDRCYSFYCALPIEYREPIIQPMEREEYVGGG